MSMVLIAGCPNQQFLNSRRYRRGHLVSLVLFILLRCQSSMQHWPMSLLLWRFLQGDGDETSCSLIGLISNHGAKQTKWPDFNEVIFHPWCVIGTGKQHQISGECCRVFMNLHRTGVGLSFVAKLEALVGGHSSCFWCGRTWGTLGRRGCSCSFWTQGLGSGLFSLRSHIGLKASISDQFSKDAWHLEPH